MKGKIPVKFNDLYFFFLSERRLGDPHHSVMPPPLTNVSGKEQKWERSQK